MNKIIGLIGEDPNDTKSIRHLLEQKMSDGLSYEYLLKNKKGYQLDNANTKKALAIECAYKKPDVLIFIRDADGLVTEKHKITKCREWYENLSTELKVKKTLLINIYELEALIFANIDKFNTIYKTSIKGNRDITYIKQPKEELIKATRKTQKKFSEADCPAVFKEISIDAILSKCSYFKTFYEDLQNC